MITHLRIEGPADIDQPSHSLLGSLIRSFGTPDGPTYVILTGPDNQYMQAAGSAERFVLESRDQYGEGFLHLWGGTIAGRQAVRSKSTRGACCRWDR